MKLTSKRVAKLLKRAGRYGDGHGLVLQVRGPNNASWLLRYQIGGRERMLGLGPVHDVSLQVARERAREKRLLLRDGRDPIDATRADRARAAAAATKAMTFAQAARQFFDQNEARWGNAKHRNQFTATMNTYVLPIMGDAAVAAIDRSHVLRVLEQHVAADRGHPAGVFWYVRPETARRVRARIESVLNWCAARGYRDGDNPARWSGHLQHVLPPRTAVAPVVHHAALPFGDVAAFMADLRTREGVAARALEFAILTTARTNEVIGARWDEIDLVNRTWSIPAGRMKARIEHRVPLSTRAVEILTECSREPDNDFVFIGARPGTAINHSAMAEVLDRMDRGDVTVHGFRSSFMDWAHEQTAFPKVVIDMSLAHTVGDKVEAAYRRGDLFAKRRALMAAWATFCATSTSAVVVPMQRAAEK